ncbi:MAG: DMT family transporter [Patescibacteria group bacterium]
MKDKFTQFRKWFAEATKYLPYLLCLLLFWAVVPAFSKLGNFNGLQKTFWINGFAVVALLLFTGITKLFTKNKIQRKISLYSLLKILIIGIIWPFLYSIFYFESIYLGSPSLTTLIGKTSILIYAPILVFILKKRKALAKRDLILMTLSVFAVGVALSKSINSNTIYFLAIAMAFGASIANGIYTAFAEIWRSKYNSLVFTLIIEFVTFFLSSLLVILTKSFVIPTGKDLFYLAFIGIFSNALAFWFFLKGFQIASKISNSHKVIFLVFQSSILTFAQIVVIWIFKAETVSVTTILGVVILSLGLLWYGLSAKV